MSRGGVVDRANKDGEASMPAEVWVVLGQHLPGKYSSDFVADFREGAMDHATDLAGMPEAKEFGPFRVARYVLSEKVGGIPDKSALPECGTISVIEVEKRLLKELGREWTPTGISIDSLVTELASRSASGALSPKVKNALDMVMCDRQAPCEGCKVLWPWRDSFVSATQERKT